MQEARYPHERHPACVDLAAPGPAQATTEASLKRAAERAAKPPGSRKAGKPPKEEPPEFGLFETQCLVIINVRILCPKCTQQPSSCHVLVADFMCLSCVVQPLMLLDAATTSKPPLRSLLICDDVLSLPRQIPHAAPAGDAPLNRA